MAPGDQEFWRVSNSGSDTIVDLQVLFDGVPQSILIVGIDGVPVNSQDGTQPGRLIPVTHFHLPPASRVEFLVNSPPSNVQVAQLTTQLINTGPLGDEDPARREQAGREIGGAARGTAAALMAPEHLPPSA